MYFVCNTFPVPVVWQTRGSHVSCCVGTNGVKDLCAESMLTRKRLLIQMSFKFELLTYTDMTHMFSWVVTSHYLVPACLRLSTTHSQHIRSQESGRWNISCAFSGFVDFCWRVPCDVRHGKEEHLKVGSGSFWEPCRREENELTITACSADKLHFALCILSFPPSPPSDRRLSDVQTTPGWRHAVWVSLSL